SCRFAGRHLFRRAFPELARRPAGWRSERAEVTKWTGIGDDQISPKPGEHAGAIIAYTKFSSGDMQERPYMSAEALWRAVVKVIGDVRDGKAGVFKQTSGTNKSRHRQVSFWRRGTGSKEPAHQCAWSDIQEFGELPNVSDTG